MDKYKRDAYYTGNGGYFQEKRKENDKTKRIGLF